MPFHLNPEEDSPELEAELLKAANSPLTRDVSRRLLEPPSFD